MITKTNYQNFTASEDDRGVVTVSINVPGRQLNVITPDVMTELADIVFTVEHSHAVRAVVFESGKESGFLAGADVSIIAGIESSDEATRLIVGGQSLFQRIAWLPVPTIVVIDGPCLGGGLEWALACDYRIARNNSHTKIGLPEIQLGLIPGWGGTQRLPRQVGTHVALDMILTGKHVAATDALRIGLVDRAFDPDDWDAGRERFLKQVLAGRKVRSRKWRSRLMTWLSRSSVGRNVVLHTVGKKVNRKAEHYPALSAAVRAVRASFENGPVGYQVERDEFVALLAGSTSKHLLGLFFSRENARKLATWTPTASVTPHDHPIRRVGVVGAGAMGAGIAQLAAVRDFEVVVKEVGADLLRQGQTRIEKLINGLARRKDWSEQKRSETLERINYTTDLDDMRDCDLVIEAVVEKASVKASVFAELDSVTRPDAVLASNTSSLSVTRMSDSAVHPNRVAGLHFFNPVHRMELVEVVRGDKTDETTIARLVGFVKAMGKTPVVTADRPGFLVNRVLFPYLGEAIRMLGEGHRADAIDREVRRFGMPMGPLELLDQVGLDVAMHVAGSLQSVSSCVDDVVDPLTRLVSSGRLGKKSGVGFYQYRNGKKGKPLAYDFEKVSDLLTPNEHDFAADGLNLTQRRLIYTMLIEAITCHQEHVVEQPWAIDLAMVLGTGFAPFRGGPLHVADAIGLDRMIHNCEHLGTSFGDRFAAPEELLVMARRGDSYFGRSGVQPVSVNQG